MIASVSSLFVVSYRPIFIFFCYILYFYLDMID